MAQGSITKHVAKNGMVRWRVRVDAGIDPITGMRRQPMRSFPTKREAATGLARWITEIERGTAVDPSKQTLGEYLQHWLATGVQPRVRPATHSGYERLIRVQIIPRLGNIPLQKLTALQIQQCYTDMRTSPRVDGRDGTLSPRSVCYAHTVLKQALKQAARWRLISHNMAADVDPPKEVRPHVQVWNVAEAQWFLAAFQGDAYSPLWRVALSTGMRLGELRGLRWCDVDLSRGLILVRQQITRVNRCEVVSEPKTKAGRLSISLPQECIVALKEHRASRPPRPIFLGEMHDDTDLVFARIDGRPLSQDTICCHFNRMVKRSGLTRITLHGLRHTHATLLLLRGVNAKAVSARLGHAGIQITLDTYAHLLPEMEEQAANAIGEALRSVG